MPAGIVAVASDTPALVQRVTSWADPNPSPTLPPVPGPAPSQRPSWVTRIELLRVKLQPKVKLCGCCVPDPAPEVKLSAIVSARIWREQKAIVETITRAEAGSSEEILVFIGLFVVVLQNSPAPIGMLPNPKTHESLLLVFLELKENRHYCQS